MKAAGFSADAIESLIGTYAKLPPVAKVDVKAETAQAISNLTGVQKQIKGTKGKTVTVSTLTAAARKNLEDLGFKIKNTKDKKVSITVPTGSQQSAVNALAAAIAALHDKAVTITTSYVIKGSKTVPGGTYFGSTAGRSANGNLYGPAERYASGGMREQHVAQIAQPTLRMWAEPETGGEGYIPMSPAKRVRSTQILREIAERFGYRLEKYASGGLNGFTYTPTGQPVLGGPSDAKQRYDDLIGRLKDAWKEYQEALAERNKVLKDKKSTKSEKAAAQKAAAKAFAEVKALDAALGFKAGAPAPKGFSLAAYQKQLNNSLKATQTWRTNLNKIGKRGGEDLRAMLEAMGEDGATLVSALAGASDKQFKDIAAKLKATGDLAKTTLADFTKQLGASTTESKTFAADLQKLAAQGFGDLAQALAAQGDSTAMTLAHQAASSSTQAAAANKAVAGNQAVLSGEDLANAITLLSTLRGGTGRGFAQLIAAGLDVATIRALVPKMTAQIKSLPGPNRDTFIRQWVQQGGKAMAAGGILSRPTMVLGGEAGDVESWIPWNNSARSRGLLAKTAAAMGYQLVPAGRYGGGGARGPAAPQQMVKNIEVHLHAAKQSTAEQVHDVARVISFVG